MYRRVLFSYNVNLVNAGLAAFLVRACSSGFTCAVDVEGSELVNVAGDPDGASVGVDGTACGVVDGVLSDDMVTAKLRGR